MKTKNIKISVQCFLLAVLVVFAVFSLITFDNLNEEIRVLKEDVEKLQKCIEDQNLAIENIHQGVEEQLRKEASLFSDINYHYEGFSFEDGTTDMVLTVVPKTLISNMHLQVVLGDQTKDFEMMENGAFSAVIPTKIFSEGQHPLVILETDTEKKTELLESVKTAELWLEYLPTLFADMEGSANYDQANNRLKMVASLKVEYKAATKFDAHFVEMSIVAKTNNGEISKEDITSHVKGNNKDKIISGTYTAPFNDTYHVVLGEDFYVYIVAKDSLGYTHEYLAYHWLRNTNDSTQELIEGVRTIYDANGNILYRGK